MATATRNDPYSNFNFVVQIEGISEANFTECSGLCSQTEVITYREGGQFGVRALPGRTSYSAITLKRGITADLSLWNWYKATAEGRPDRRNGAIILLDGERKEVARWNFRNGWPAKYCGPALNAAGNDIALETLEIVHEGLERES